MIIIDVTIILYFCIVFRKKTFFIEFFKVQYKLTGKLFV
jgi:hypothetical protein